MILTKYLKIIVSNNQRKYYKELGYFIPNKDNSVIEIDIKDLPKGSGQNVKVKCDICGKEKCLSYNRYNINLSNGGFYCCSRKCAESKNIKTLQEKYGVNNISLLEMTKDKKIKTCRNNNGSDFPMQNKNIIEKSQKVKKEKYGDKNYNNPNKMILNKEMNTSKKYNSINYKSGIFTFECKAGTNLHKTLPYAILRNIREIFRTISIIMQNVSLIINFCRQSMLIKKPLCINSSFVIAEPWE